MIDAVAEFLVLGDNAGCDKGLLSILVVSVAGVASQKISQENA